jgi:hypothetical protein
LLSIVVPQEWPRLEIHQGDAFEHLVAMPSPQFCGWRKTLDISFGGEGMVAALWLFALDRHTSAGWYPVASVVGGRHWTPACAGVT